MATLGDDSFSLFYCRRVSAGFATYAGLRHARVVLVEGFDDLRDVLTMTLAHAGFDVRAFAAAHEAFASVASDVPHVVIVGASPLELSDEFGRRLRADDRTRRAGRIAVTERPDRAGELGALFHAVLVKPVDTERLLDEVARLVASWGVAPKAERRALPAVR
jgi:DNA-binding response OmpR family regulator